MAIMTETTQTDAITATTAIRPRQDIGARRAYVFGPVIDFLCLGGGSLIVCAALVLFLPQGLPQAQQAGLTALLVTAINQPHFAHSYQLFYANFRDKAFGAAYPPP